MPIPIEHVEYKLLCRAVQEAAQDLVEGEVARGYRCLRCGFDRACEYAAEGEAWGTDLARSYLAAMFYYSTLYPCSSRIKYTPRWRRFHGTVPEGAPMAN